MLIKLVTHYIFTIFVIKMYIIGIKQQKFMSIGNDNHIIETALTHTSNLAC